MQPFAVRRVRIQVDPPSDTPPVVLFVTEDGDLRAAAERVLTDAGFDVMTAAHGGHAVLACLGGRHIDALVTELCMRDMAGPRLAQRIRRHYPDLPVIYLASRDTREGEGSSPRLATALKASVLVRPFTRDDLIHRLETALAAPTA